MAVNLSKLAQQISNLLQHFEDESRKLDPKSVPAIRFPRGRIKTTDSYRNRVPFIKNPRTKSNIAYSLQLMDAITWLLERFDLTGIAREMLIKNCLVLLGSVAEVFARLHLNKQGITPSKKFKKNLDKLEQNKFINSSLCTQLRDLQEKRDNIHLDKVGKAEIGKYSDSDYYEALSLIAEYRKILNKLNATQSS